MQRYNESYAKQPLQYKQAARKKMKTIGYAPSLRDVKGLPKFHSKKQGKLSYTTNQTNGNIKVTQQNGAHYLCIPKFQERIRIALHRELPLEGYRYIAPLSVDYPFVCEPPKEQDVHIANELKQTA